MSIPFNSSSQQDEGTLRGKPEWLDFFLKRTFFDTCSVHKLSKNDLNNYCINCDLPVCKYCILASGSHSEHRILKIYRHVYKDVVPLCDMEKHIDCSKIQPYKSNKQWVVALNPLPHNGSGSQTDEEAACDVCRRILNHPNLYRYCCISCKAEAFSRKKTESDPPFLAVKTRKTSYEATVKKPPAVNGIRYSVSEAGENKRKRRRKGTPHRAPMF